MTRSSHTVTAAIIVALCFSVACASLYSSRPDDVALSPALPSDVVFAPDSDSFFTVETGRNRITERRCSDATVLHTYRCTITPHALAVSPSGSVVYVAAGNEHGQLIIFDRLTGKILGRQDVGHTPCAVALDTDGRFLYISNRFTSTVSVFDCDIKSIVETMPLLREPVDIALTPDGKYLFVANHLPSSRQIPSYVTDGGYMDISGYKHGTDYSVSSVIMIIDTSRRRIVRMVHLPNGSTSLRGICVSPDGRYAYVSHVLARYHLPTAQLDRGFMNTNAVSIIDIQNLSYLNTILLDSIDRGAANPWGITCSPDGKHLYVTHAGTHELSVINRPAMHQRLDNVISGIRVTAVSDSAGAVPNDLTFLSGVRLRVSLTGNGPRAVSANDSLVVVSEYYSGTASLISITDPDHAIQSRQVSFGPPPQYDPIFDGERLFNDATLCFQNWQSCASCHPDGRADGLNWDLLNDGIGNPKNTKSLLYTHHTPPVMITGIRPDAETAVRAGLMYIQFNDYDEQTASLIDAYLSSLEPIPSPHRSDPAIRRYANNGKRLFRETGCLDCHPEPLYTDLRTYNVGTGSGRERGMAFDTPTLAELWRTAPYLYDGRARALDDLFRYYNRNDMHGSTSKLTERQQYELLCYLLTL